VGTSAKSNEPTVRLLGPVAVVGTGSGSLAPRERALLARLAIDAGRTVGLARLVDDLWGDDPPNSARNALQVYVSHLRGRLGRQAIVSMGGGYRLELALEGVDALAFERLVAVAMGQRSGGRADEAIKTLDVALGLWCGDALSDLRDYAFAVIEAARLDELRATGMEHLAEALLATGDLDRVTGELASAVRDFPFRERLRVAVMTALYRQGRAVDALGLYAEAVDQLREELGLEPGPALKATQHAILTDSPVLTAKRADNLPTGELTLVAAILESPTVLEERLGDEYGDTVLAHRNLLRETVTSHHGLTFTGDSERLLATFSSPADAVRAAAAAHRALASHQSPDLTAVRVRIGVHTGTPRMVERHYVGAEVHRVVQVALAAAGGQTVVTASTANRLDEDVANGEFHLTDLGTHRLPDIALPQHLHQVSVDPDVEFPPPRSLGTRSNLPRAAVPFVGRRALLATLVDDVAQAGLRITTLVGPGGTGKTRLAVEVARQLGTAMADGVYFIELDSARSEADVWAGIASALGLPAGAFGPTPILAQLAGRRTLLVLDNLEQVGEVGAVLETLLRADGAVTLLATSRRPTGIAGERLRHLEPLSDGEEAIELFSLYAKLARPAFILDDTNRAAVARICRRVDGLPLGIELAAARVRQLTPHALAAALDDGLDLVNAGSSRPARQRDLHALTAWSVDLLEPHEQQLLELLAVFEGGVDLDTVARFPVADEDPANPVTGVLDLADANLVRISPDDRPRVTMLDTIREYAMVRLRSSGREAAARDAHLAVHLDLARRLHPRIASQDRVTSTVVRERRNFEVALDHALAGGPSDIEAAAEILVHLADSWHQLGTRGFDYIERVAAALAANSPHRGWMTYWNYRRIWDIEVDEHVVMEALRVAEAELRANEDIGPLAALLGYGTDLGLDLGFGADWGINRAQEAVELARTLDDDWLLAHAHASLARTLIAAGRLREAYRPLADAKHVAARHKDLHRLDVLTLTEAELVAHGGRRAEAWALAQAAAPGLVSASHDGTLWSTCSVLARLVAEERPEASATLVGIALSALGRMGSVPTQTDLERLFAGVSAAVGALGQEAFDRAVREGRETDADTAIAWVLDVLAAPTYD
jgi:predicted ATPase/DNA-binding SARP family transcriptional activator